jgi:hypothetical protein
MAHPIDDEHSFWAEIVLPYESRVRGREELNKTGNEGEVLVYGIFKV